MKRRYFATGSVGFDRDCYIDVERYSDGSVLISPVSTRPGLAFTKEQITNLIAFLSGTVKGPQGWEDVT